jgi:hypothetical protein
VIPNTKDRSLSSHGVGASSEFGISLKDSAHIMTILRDTLYSDKVLAVLREYSANAWDSHRQSGKPELPIKVVLPTAMEPSLSIRDFGTGLSEEDVFNVYTQYGASTKRDSDTAVGMLGIGSKSGFAYSDSFTITSWHGGMKKIYVAVLDKTEKGLINKLHEEPCGADETGVEIQIAVRPQDIEEFRKKAVRLFQYFIPRPDINTELPALPDAVLKLQHGIIYDDPAEDAYRYDTKWIAIMGCVPYRISMDQVRGKVADFLSRISGALFFNIGEVQINASREELKYSDGTIAALVEKFTLLVDEYVEKTLEAINNSQSSIWERRIRAQVLGKLKLPVPKESKALIASSVSIADKDMDDDKIRIGTGKDRSHSITVSPNTRLLIRDVRRTMKGYRTTSYDYIVDRVDPKLSWDEVHEEVSKTVKSMDIEGIPVLRLSEMEWTSCRAIAAVNAKHRLKLFEFDPSAAGYSKLSDRWDATERVPTKDDVFVIIHGFEGKGFDFFSAYSRDKTLLKHFVKGHGRKMPTVYGYKWTAKKPITESDCVGISYKQWREEFHKSLLTDENKALLEEWTWRGILDESGWGEEQHAKKSVPTLRKALGLNHPITQAIISYRRAVKKFGRRNFDDRHHKVELLEETIGKLIGKKQADVAVEAIYAKYPLLPLSDWKGLWKEGCEKWLHYINLVDSAEKLAVATITPEGSAA